MMPIGEVAQRAGLRPSAIRYYERIGLVPAPERHGGRRRYTEAILDRLALIRFARETGFTLAQIRTVFAGRRYSERLRHFARDRILELEETVAHARAMQTMLEKALRCRCSTLEECGRRMPREARLAMRERRPRGTKTSTHASGDLPLPARRRT
jgi:MerR family transcriptional regulator, redox-sensitive transcriptional activator SoxR